MKRTMPKPLGLCALAASAVLVAASQAAAAACGQPVTTGNKPTATDALFVLKAAVGSGSCELCICDTDGDTKITATDALRVLFIAVGLPASLSCPQCPTTTTVPPTTTSTTGTTTSTSTTTTTTGGSQPPLTAGDFPDVTPCSDRNTLPNDPAFKDVLMNATQYGYWVWFTEYSNDGFPEICGLPDADNSLPPSAIPWDPGKGGGVMRFLFCLNLPPNVADLLDPFRLPLGHGPEICQSNAQPGGNGLVQVEAMPRPGIYRREGCVEANGNSYNFRTRFTVSGPGADKTFAQLGITRNDVRFCNGPTEIVTMDDLRALVVADPAHIEFQVRKGSCSGNLLLNVLAETICVKKLTTPCEPQTGFCF